MQFVSTAVPFLPLRASLVHSQLCSSIHSAWRKIINNVLIRASRQTGSLSPAAPSPSNECFVHQCSFTPWSPAGAILISVCYLLGALPFRSRSWGPHFPPCSLVVTPRLLRDELFLPLGGTRCIPQRNRTALGVCACSAPGASLEHSLGIPEAAGRAWGAPRVLCELGACSRMETCLETLLLLLRDAVPGT